MDHSTSSATTLLQSVETELNIYDFNESYLYRRVVGDDIVALPCRALVRLSHIGRLKLINVQYDQLVHQQSPIHLTPFQFYDIATNKDRVAI